MGALLPTRDIPITNYQGPPGESERVEPIPLEAIDPNPYQPRRVFDHDSLEELAQSIRMDGVIQPILVRPAGERYTLVAGERRVRAAKIAGLLRIPAIIREIPQDRLLEVTLVENVQRENLNPIEEAQAYDRMSRELGIVHEEIANRTGRDRSTITNYLRLLRLPPDVQQLVAERRISPGHARPLLALTDEEQQRRVAEKAAAQGLSVRQVERLVHRLTEERESGGGEEDEARLDPNIAAALREMEQALGTRVRLVERGKDRGKIEIEYYSAEDLDRIYTVIVGDAG